MMTFLLYKIMVFSTVFILIMQTLTMFLLILQLMNVKAFQKIVKNQ